MKAYFKPLILLTACMMIVFLGAMKAKPKKIIFFGDSITQAGIKPGGYIDMIKQSLGTPEYELIGAGIGGNKVYDLYLRLEEDVLDKKPDQVVIWVGVNDVWHKQSSGTGTDYDKFVKFYQALINKIKAGGSKVVLCTPAVIGEKRNGANELDAELDKYSGAIRELASKNDVPLCDLRKVFSEYNLKHNPDDLEKGILTTDRVHLNAKGNEIVALSMIPLIK